MKKFLLLGIIALCAVVSMSAKQRYELKLSEFTTVKVLDPITVDVVCNPDSVGKIVFFAEDEEVNRIMFEDNQKGKLTIQTENEYNSIQLPKVKVFVSSLTMIENATDSTTNVNCNGISMPELKIKTSGNGTINVKGVNATKVDAMISTGKGKINVAGKCTYLNVSNIGTGTIDAYKLETTNVSAHMIGTGNVYCKVNGGPISLRGSGSGKLYYKGKPSDVSVKKLGKLAAIPAE